MNLLNGLMARFQFPAPKWPSRDELERLPPATRLSLLALFGSCVLAGAATLSAVIVIEAAAWENAAPMTRSLGLAAGTGKGGAGEVMLQRPLFVRSRRLAIAVAAPPPPPPPAPPAVMQDPSVGLKGVFINGKTGKAFLTTAQNPGGVWVAPDDMVGGWRLVAVRPDEVELEGSGQRMVVPFITSSVRR
ncbi:hypothetical protein [Bradyrhizobium sp. Tv2a-2]|uniref:hypothetical protein n=1 Tax=Bradyrhizobium sp. Tv2a-2 TaxID=113395 RepID=UPI00041305BB|nr:hypothetical protein [Bradyrhizobium sp. Tv2a-2]